MSLEVGNPAPDFNVPSSSGNSTILSELKGKIVILYFYPKDNTSGCTKEACSFRDNMPNLTSIGAEVIGVSPDSLKSHANFIEKHNLNFTLLCDTDKVVCNMYDVIAEKSMYGKKYLGVVRSTFLIDENGIIRFIWKNVKVDGHTEQILEKIKELKLND